MDRPIPLSWACAHTPGPPLEFPHSVSVLKIFLKPRLKIFLQLWLFLLFYHDFHLICGISSILCFFFLPSRPSFILSQLYFYFTLLAIVLSFILFLIIQNTDATFILKKTLLVKIHLKQEHFSSSKPVDKISNLLFWNSHPSLILQLHKFSPVSKYVTASLISTVKQYMCHLKFFTLISTPFEGTCTYIQ